MLVITAGGSKYSVSAERGERLKEALRQGVKFVDINGAMVAASSVMEIRDEEPGTAELTHGKWRCEHGHIHPAVDTYCGIGDLTKKPALTAANPKSPEQEAEEHSRGRRAMDGVRQNLKQKLGWK